MMKYPITYFENIFRNYEVMIPEMQGRFSVLALFVYYEEEARLLFEVRAEHMRRQPGEICFPGGHIEEEESPRDCAIRETSEELLVPKEKLKIISELGYEYTYTGDLLHSFVGVIDPADLHEKQVNSDEVKEIFTVPFSYFMELGSQDAYDYDGHYIWGLTARVVRRLLKLCKSFDERREPL